MYQDKRFTFKDPEFILRGIFGIGAALRRDIYEGYQDICRYLDGKLTEENIREIISVPVEEGDMLEEDGAWYLLKKIC